MVVNVAWGWRVWSGRMRRLSMVVETKSIEVPAIRSNVCSRVCWRMTTRGRNG